jgi:hypothetical protein
MLVEVDVCSGGGGGGSTTPGECMTPANADTASDRLRATTALVRRNLFIVVVPPTDLFENSASRIGKGYKIF